MVLVYEKKVILHRNLSVLYKHKRFRRIHIVNENIMVMILSSFSYKEAHWDLVGFGPLNPENLVVGRNSTGKTRTIHAIQHVASYMQMKDFPMRPNSFYAEMSFAKKIADCTWTMIYTMKVKKWKNREREPDYRKQNINQTHQDSGEVGW